MGNAAPGFELTQVVQMSGRMAGKVAVVTGGGGGLGEAIGSLFCEEGGRVVLVDRNEAALETVAAGIAERVADAEVGTIVGDVASPADAAASFACATERFGGLDVLVMGLPPPEISPSFTSLR